MPRVPTPSSSRPMTRRSTRLHNNKNLVYKIPDFQDNAIVEIEESPKVKRRKLAVKETNSPSVCRADNPLGKVALRRSQRITPTELLKREQALLLKEQDCIRRTDELDKRCQDVMKKEDQVSCMLSQIQEREARAALTDLEEHFTCPLCYEIMAYPYSLNPGQCGHTFCAICIIKWFFSRLHKVCGGWHESVDCPICRSLLVITPDRTPRLDITFPFVPNRLAGSVITALVEKVSRIHPSGSMSFIKIEESESGSEMEWGMKKGRTKEEEEAEESSGVSAWSEGGIAKTEWQKKDREGRREMDYLSTEWTMLDSGRFVELKQKLGV